MILLFFISNFPVYEETNKQENNSNNNTNETDKLKRNDIFYTKSLKIKNIDLIKENGLITYKNESLDKKRVDGLPNIKLFLLLFFCWISDEGQKLYGLCILLPFLEFWNYLSNHFNSKINEIINNNYDTTNSKLNKIYDDKTDRNNNSNLYFYYFMNFFVIQEMFIIGNQSSFALMQNSFGLEFFNSANILS